MGEEGLFGGRETDRPEGRDGLGWEAWLILLAIPSGLAAVAFLALVVGGALDSPGGGVLRGGTRAVDPTRLSIGLGLGLVLAVSALLLARNEEGGTMIVDR